jgi:transcriptional regulator with XRE-family HTH domain
MQTMLTEEDAVRNVAANVRRLIEVRGWTQRDLARAIGVYDGAISTLLAGEHIVRFTLLAQVADVLETSMDRLVLAVPENSFQKIG